MSERDATQVIKKVYDESSNSLNTNIVSGELTISAENDSIKIAGTEDGTSTGDTKYFVNTIRQQILATKDMVASFTWADFGTSNERVSSISYTSPTIPGTTVIKTFAYTLVGSDYRLDSITWSVS